ncbi:peptidoglycan-binding protein [Candidatus Parcubacteria bacterium]|nr:MAG: peptidoglycan-binding protein [Candidatus Parcubacteria bacterium]
MFQQFLFIALALVTMAGIVPSAYAQTTCPYLYRTLQSGSQGTDVMQLNRFLAAQGLLDKAYISNYYGYFTEQAVRQFQAKKGIVSSGLPETSGYGAVGPRTRAAIAAICPPDPSSYIPQPTPQYFSPASAGPRTLVRGMSGTDVLQLQAFLIINSFLPITAATGFFGPLTEGAVQQFQIEQGIASYGSPDTTGFGAVGPRTRNAIATYAAPPSALAQRPQEPSLVPDDGSPVVSFDVTPPSITEGQYVTISWNAINATGCTGTNFNTARATQGAMSVYPVETTTYSIACTGTGGTKRASKRVTVVPDTQAPAASLSASPSSVVPGQTATLIWTSSNATMCTGNNFQTNGSTSGSANVAPQTDTTYVVTCVGPRGEATARMTIVIDTSWPPEMTIHEFLEHVMPQDRYQAIAPLIGTYSGSGSPITLGSFYKTTSPDTLRSAIIDDFDIGDLVPPLDALPIASITAPSTPSWARALRVCGTRDLNGPSSLFYKKSRCIDASDTLDWLVIQIAIRRSVESGKQFILDLPKQSGSYAVNQVLSVPSGLHLRWIADSSGNFSYIAMTGNSDNGTIFGNMNPYNLYVTPTVAPIMVENVWYDNPRIDGRNIPGENGISFGRGARNNKITGGEIKNLVFDTVTQGGRGVQCEQGCEALRIEGLTVRHSTFGISSNSIEANHHYIIADPNMMQSSMIVRDVVMDDVEVPFVFSNTKADASSEPDRQSVDVDGARITNSGALNRARVKNRGIDAFSYISPTTTARVWCYDQIAIAKLYDLSEYYGPLSSGIFYLSAPRNITVRNVTIDNDSSYPKIGALVRGESGSNISISDVTFNGKARAVFNLTGGATGPTTGVVKLKDIFFNNITGSGTFDYAVLAATDLPVIRAVKDSAGKPAGRCVVLPNADKFQNIQWNNIRVNGKPITDSKTQAAAAAGSEQAVSRTLTLLGIIFLIGYALIVACRSRRRQR